MPTPQDLDPNDVLTALSGGQDTLLRPPLGPANLNRFQYDHPLVQAGADYIKGLMALPQRAFQSSENLRLGGEYDPEPVVDLASMFMGGGIPAAERGAVGVFGGRLAATADRAALSKAEELATKGADRDTIWNQTGGFQGPDKQWRFEIPDTGAQALQKGMGEINLPETRPSNLGGAMNHPELYQAYPELERLPFNVIDERFEKPSKEMGYRTPLRSSAGFGEQINSKLELEPFIQIGDMNYVDKGSNRPTSVLLHEIQHAIQKKEGFSPGAPGFNLPRKEYLNTAGEVEARNVQSRQKMTPEQRRAQPPWMTQDVPDAEQIIRMLGSSK